VFQVSVLYQDEAGKKIAATMPATRSSCKIQFMENGKFLFRVKDRNIAECGFIDVHSEW
jgi:hypothetical protein